MTQIPRGIPWARSIKPYAEYVDTLNDFGKKGGEYGVKVGAWGGPVLGLSFVGGIRQGAFPVQGLWEKVGELPVYLESRRLRSWKVRRGSSLRALPWFFLGKDSVRPNKKKEQQKEVRIWRRRDERQKNIIECFVWLTLRYTKIKIAMEGMHHLWS